MAEVLLPPGVKATLVGLNVTPSPLPNTRIDARLTELAKPFKLFRIMVDAPAESSLNSTMSGFAEIEKPGVTVHTAGPKAGELEESWAASGEVV
jgi:hypothetical protein